MIPITNFIWLDNAPQGNGVLYALNYYSSVEALYCTSPEPWDNWFEPPYQTVTNPVADHAVYGASAFGEPGRFAGGGVYLPRERFVNRDFNLLPGMADVKFTNCEQRAMSFCPFLFQNGQTHRGRGVVVGYGNNTVDFLPFGDFRRTGLHLDALGWLDSHGENQHMYYGWSR